MSETPDPCNQGPQVTTASTPGHREDQPAQPIDLAQISASTMSGSGSIPPRLIDASKPVYLVKQAGSPGPAASVGQTPAVTLATHVPSASTAVIQQGPVSVSLPIAMARIQTAIRPGATVTLAPRTPTLVTTYANVPVSLPVSHVPKGPAAVASIAIPRSAVATAAVIRPAPSATASAVAPTSRATSRPAAIRPTEVTVASGTWVSTGNAPVIQAVGSSNATVYKPASGVQAAAGKSATTNLILTGTGQKAAGSTAVGNSGVISQAKAPLPNVSSSITLLSVRGPSTTGIRAPTTAPSSASTVPRISGEIMKSNATLLQPAPHRPPSMTITSTSNVQGVEKHYVKTVQGTGPAGTRAASTPSPVGQIHIAARTVAASTTISSTATVSATGNSTNASSTPVVFASGLKNITPITTVTNVGKGAGQIQMSVTAVASAKLAGASHAPVVGGTRAAPASASGGTPVSLAPAMTSRTYLVTTQPHAASSIIPVAKVLPQPAAAASGGHGASSTKAVDLSATSAASASDTLSGASANNSTAGLYLHATGRSAAAPGDGTSGSTQHLQPHQATQSNTPSKMGTSPRPSILRKRDFDGTPLKAQKNLSATLAMMTPSTVSSSSGSASVVTTTPMSVSPPSPRARELVGLTPIASGPNGDSSRSSSGGSTTLSASSSPGIPPDMDDSNPPINIVTSSASALLGKALSSIQVKQEAMENAETGSVASSLIRLGPLSTQSAPVEMSPRKKPRKQQLQGQELQEVRSSDDEIQEPHVTVKGEPRHETTIKSEPKECVTVVKRPRVTLMSTYRQTWKARNHHFVRYSDVKLKDERRPTVSDLANQKHVMQKVHGWKVYHLSAQIDEMAFSESQVHDRLSAILDALEKLGGGKASDRDLVRVNELIKGNLQRSKVIHDGLLDSKNQVHKIFDHKPRAEEIIHRYMFKRLSKKREKS